MNCPYCNYSVTYKLKTNQEKCSKCKRKFSPNKILLDEKICESFCNDNNVNETAKSLETNYITVQKRFINYRKYLASYLEAQYSLYETSQYDEYVYLPKSKKKIKENIFEAQNFLTFCYDDNKVYNLLMPNLNRYKEQYRSDNLEEVYFREFSHFMMFNKIAKTKKMENPIVQFWNFFENTILQYKGVNSENFFYYLKECEFKFNYTKDQRVEILSKIL
ncbi:MAG: transposase [Arcobacteraceae bacterium]|nr:transposase [Arcobacteraceae bacterium]